MSYSGYRIQLEQTVLNNSWIAKGTFNVSRSPRIAKNFKDIVGIDHDVTYPSTKTIITFSIREHNSSEHSEISNLFSQRANRSITYWDDDSDDYLTKSFKIKDFTWNHLNAFADSIDYGETAITLEEY